VLVLRYRGLLTSDKLCRVRHRASHDEEGELGFRDNVWEVVLVAALRAAGGAMWMDSQRERVWHKAQRSFPPEGSRTANQRAGTEQFVLSRRQLAARRPRLAFP
jgi:hypothetical protein